MKATPEDQLRLLDLQKVDAEIDLLNHKAKIFQSTHKSQNLKR